MATNMYSACYVQERKEEVIN